MKEKDDCKSCDNLLDQVRRLSSENATLRTEKKELKKEAEFRLGLSDLWIKQLRKALSKAMDALASDPDHDVSLQARLEMTRRAVVIENKCPSTYTHSSLGKLACEKDEAHLHRRGDVEHKGGGVKWMSI
jgi:hypothetical protein